MVKPNTFSELYIVHKVQIKISSLRWSEKKVQIKVHAWTWTLAFILRSHQITVTHLAQTWTLIYNTTLQLVFKNSSCLIVSVASWSSTRNALSRSPDKVVAGGRVTFPGSVTRRYGLLVTASFPASSNTHSNLVWWISLGGLLANISVTLPTSGPTKIIRVC